MNIKRKSGYRLYDDPLSGKIVNSRNQEMHAARVTPRITSLCHLGELSLDEFIDGARRDKWVMKMLQMDVNPGDWLSERRRSADF